MNGLNNSSLFPYSLNNLQIVQTSDGGTLPVSADVPLIKTLTSTNQNISLYESSPDVIDFEFYNKSLNVDDFEANNIFSNGSMNAPAANISSFALTASSFITTPFFTGARMDIGIIRANTGSINSLTGGQLFFNSGTFNNITAGNISINTLNIPNLTFGVATGAVINSNTGSFNSLRFTGATGGSIFANDIVATSNIISNGSMNAPNANIACFAVSPSSFVFSPFYTGSRAEFDSVRANTGSFNILSSTGVNTSNLVFSTATGSNLISNNLVFNTSTGTNLTSTNFVFNTSTGTNLTSTTVSFTTAIGGTLNSSVVVRNPQILSFNKIDNTEIVRIEPAGVADVLSFFNSGGVLQTLYSTTSSGANVDNLNQLGTKDITNLGRVFNGNGNQASPSYSFVNDTDTGLYTEGSDTISLGLGNRRMTFFQPNLVSFGSGASNGVSVDVYGTLQVGGTSNANSALIDLGYSGSINGVNNSRMGFISTNGTTLEINHQQRATGSTSVGQIQFTPGNDSSIRLLKQPNGILSNIGRNDGYAHQFSNLQTGGLGMLTTLVNKPDSAYLFSSQGPGFHSAITMHGSLGQQMSNITAGRVNFPFTNNEFFTARPWSPTGSTSLCMKVANQVSENNGFACFGMFASGTNSINRNHTYISNSAVLGGIGFYTNDSNVIPTTYPRYLIDVAGNHSFSVKTATGVFGVSSIPFAVGIGESFSATRGNGRYVPVARGNLNNTSYTGGSEFIARGTADSNNNHSAYTSNGFLADWKGYYRIQWNVNGSFSTSADTLFIRIKIDNVIKNVCACQFPTTGQIGNSTGYALLNLEESDDIELFFEANVNLFNCANDSYFQIEYVG